MKAIQIIHQKVMAKVVTVMNMNHTHLHQHLVLIITVILVYYRKVVHPVQVRVVQHTFHHFHRLRHQCQHRLDAIHSIFD